MKALEDENRALKAALSGYTVLYGQVCNEFQTSSYLLYKQERDRKAQQDETRALKSELSRHKALYEQLCNEFNALEAFSLRLFQQQRDRVQKCTEEKRRCETELKSLREMVKQSEDRADSVMSRISNAARFLENINTTLCPISLQPMTHPVAIKCGHVFQSEYIYKWVDQKRSCPVCRYAFVNGERVSSGALHKILLLITRMNECSDAFEMVYLLDRIKAEFRNTMMRDPVLVPCGALMDRNMVGLYYCNGCNADHETYQPMPPYLQDVWNLLKEG